MHPSASFLLTAAFALLSGVVLGLFAWLFARHGSSRIGAVAFTTVALGGMAALSLSGVLARWDSRPPPMALLIGLSLAACIALGVSRAGGAVARTAPLWVLVALQSFRLPLELLMHRAASEGVMPPQMSYGGLNFDILTGLTAIPVAVVLRRQPERRLLALTWNALGTLLLLVILAVAMASTPVFAAFGPERLNTWIAYFPFVWLVALVGCALVGHVLLWRKLLGGEARAATEDRAPRR